MSITLAYWYWVWVTLNIGIQVGNSGLCLYYSVQIVLSNLDFSFLATLERQNGWFNDLPIRQRTLSGGSRKMWEMVVE